MKFSREAREILRQLVGGEHLSYHGLGDGEYEQMMTEPRPLQPLTHGNILIVGAKSSNFDDELKTHPRVVIWDSQNAHWEGKALPTNTRAVFITRFIGHADFKNIVREAKKKHVTIFNPEGTGLIAKQVRELLDIKRLPIEPWLTPPPTPAPLDLQPRMTEEPPSMTPAALAPQPNTNKPGKMKVLIPYIDFSKTNVANAHVLYEKAKEMGFETTVQSAANFVGVERKKRSSPPAIVRVKAAPKKLDTSVEILDEMIRGLKDMRDFIIATTDENLRLRAKLDKFKRFFEE